MLDEVADPPEEELIIPPPQVKMEENDDENESENDEMEEGTREDLENRWDEWYERCPRWSPIWDATHGEATQWPEGFALQNISSTTTENCASPLVYKMRG
jgi:hypothetical protein